MLLLRVSGVDALLHDAAAMLVTSDLYTLVHHSVVQELVVDMRPSVENFLNNMVSINVFAHLFDPMTEETLDDIEVFVLRHYFYNLLNGPCSVSVHAEFDGLVLHGVDDLCQLN